MLGVTRERLESFDRAIKVEPTDYPDKRGALISDFRNYLGILKVSSQQRLCHVVVFYMPTCSHCAKLLRQWPKDRSWVLLWDSGTSLR